MIKLSRRVTILINLLPFLFLLSVLVCFLLSNPVYNRKITKKMVAAEGLLDISANQSGITQIKGDWEFVWKDFVSQRSFDNPQWGRLPGSWKAAGVTDRFGWGTYVLRVTGLNPDLRYAFTIAGQTISACRILVNGETTVSIGVPGTNRENEIPKWESVLCLFVPDQTGSADIALQFSNYHDSFFGGSNAPMYLGEVSVMFRMMDRYKMTSILSFVILGVMAVFFWALFFSRHQDVHFYWFAALCAALSVRSLCYDCFALLDLFPDLSWIAYFRIGYVTFPVAMIAFIGFLRAVYPDLLSRPVKIIFITPYVLYIFCIVLFPARVTSLLLHPMLFFGFVTGMYGLAVILRAVIARKDNAQWFAVGFSFAIMAFVNDLLISMWLVSGLSLTPVGMILCLFCMAIMVIEQYSLSFEKTRNLSAQLQLTNKALRRFVPAEFLSCLHKESFSDVLPGDCTDLEMAVISADIRTFTTITEKMTPQEVFSFLNEYLELVAPFIRGNGGFIAKYEGDGFTALFPQGAEAALKAATQIQTALDRRNEQHPEKPHITIGIGIDAGMLTLGAVGALHRMDGAVISSCVNGAARFESTTKLFHSRILVSEAVYSALSDPASWLARPVEQLHIGDRTSFLFEIYSTDVLPIRELKWNTQSDLERAVFSWFSGQHEDARTFIEKVLKVFPEDYVAKYYEARLVE